MYPGTFVPRSDIPGSELCEKLQVYVTQCRLLKTVFYSLEFELTGHYSK